MRKWTASKHERSHVQSLLDKFASVVMARKALRSTSSGVTPTTKFAWCATLRYPPMEGLHCRRIACHFGELSASLLRLVYPCLARTMLTNNSVSVHYRI